MNTKLFDYIKKKLSQGVSRKVIEDNLTKSGWNEEQINSAFGIVSPANQQSLASGPRYSKVQLLLIFISFQIASAIFVGWFTLQIAVANISSVASPLFFVISNGVPILIGCIVFYVFIKIKNRTSSSTLLQANITNSQVVPIAEKKSNLPVPVVGFLGIGLGLFAGFSYLEFYDMQCSFNHNCPTGSEESLGVFIFAIIIWPIIYGFLFTIGAILLRNAKLKIVGVVIFVLGLIIAAGFFIFGTLIKRQDPNTSIQKESANLTLAQGLWYPDNKGPYQKVGKGYDLIHTPNKYYCTGIILHFASTQRKIDIEEIDSQDIGAGCLDYSGFQPKNFERISNSNVETREVVDLETGTAKPKKLKLYLVKDATGAIDSIYTKKQSTLLKITVPNKACDNNCVDDLTNMVSRMYSYH